MRFDKCSDPERQFIGNVAMLGTNDFRCWRKTVPGASRAEALAVDWLASAREARTPRVRCLAAISSPNLRQYQLLSCPVAINLRAEAPFLSRQRPRRRQYNRSLLPFLISVGEGTDRTMQGFCNSSTDIALDQFAAKGYNSK